MGLTRPFVPYRTSATQTEIKKFVGDKQFGGLLTTEFLPPLQGRFFRLRLTYRRNIEGPIPENLRKLIDSPRRPKGPHVHFHQFQTDTPLSNTGYVLWRLTERSRSRPMKMRRPRSKQDTFTHSGLTRLSYLALRIRAWIISWIVCFFENWYGYWSNALLHEGGLDWIQTLCTHDAGDHYTPAPAWMPFRRFLGYWTCVIVGRWIGGLLGCKPFFMEYTTDWDFAVAKMKGQPLLRRLLHDSYTAKTSWFKQVELSKGPKPTNAEFEEWVVDTAERKSGNNRIATAGLDIDKPLVKTDESKGVSGVNGINGSTSGDSFCR